MENNLYKEGIHIVSMNNNFYKNTRNNVLIISEKLYLSIHNNLYFFRNRLIIVLTKHPNIFLDDKNKNIDNDNNNNFKNKKTDIIFTNNEKIHNVILNNRENFRRWYPVLCKSFKIFIVDDK